MQFFENLTERQEEILALIAQGMCNKEIASKLKISVATVQNHVSALLAALAVKSRTEAAILYWQRLSHVATQTQNS